MIESNQLAHAVSLELFDCTIEDMLKNGSASVFLPYQYTAWSSGPSDGIGGEAVTDPLTVYFSVDVFGDDDRVTFKTTIPDLLDDLHEMYVGFEEDKLQLNAEDLKMMTAIRDSLAKEVARLDEWIRAANIYDEEIE